MEQDKTGITRQTLCEFTDLAGLDLLEIGCGDGRITAELAGKAGSLIAIDPDEKHLDLARKRVFGAEFRQGSGEALEFADKSFDRVLFTLSLHHQNGALALKEAGRVVRDDGRILVIEPVNDGEVERLCNLFSDERQALDQAIAAIRQSDLASCGEAIFYTDWRFADRTELLNWLFDYYQTPFDRELAGRVARFLGEKWDKQPIRLKDKLRLNCLKK